jgi:O-antigen ligase
VLRPVRDQARLERWLVFVLGFAVFAFTCGSSSFLPALYVGRVFRWPALLVLAWLALRWASTCRPLPPFPRLLLASAGTFAFVAVVSEAWTVRTILTIGRAVSLCVLFVAVGALALGSIRRPDMARRLLRAILAASIAIAVIGFILVPIPHGNAVQSASTAYPVRYRGLGENPNTVPLLLAVAIPIALWQFREARDRRGRLLLAGVVFVFLGSIVASGSRGALVGALVGAVVFILAAVRGTGRRAVLAAAAAAVAIAAFGVMTIPSAAEAGPQGTARSTTRDAERVLPLEAEIGRPDKLGSTHRSPFTSSGRLTAWRGAFGQAVDRPLLGYGFGTEASVFTDRFYYFYSATPENTYLGVFLQLGALGVLLFIGLVVVVLGYSLRALRRVPLPENWMIAAAVGAFVGAVVMAVTQTYLLAVGNLATLPVWLCGFLAAVFGATVPERQQRQDGEREVDPA